jgi:predicted P-loop ATPase
MLGKMLKDAWFGKEVLEDENFNAILEDTPEKPKSEAAKKIEKEDMASASYMEAIEKLPTPWTQFDFDDVAGMILDANLGDAEISLAAKKLGKKTGLTPARTEALIHNLSRERKENSLVRVYPELPLPEGILWGKKGIIPCLTNSLLFLRYHHKKWKFAFDELKDAPVLRGTKFPWSDKSSYGVVVNDALSRVIREFLILQWGVEFKKDDVIEAVLTIARENPFNPVSEYLNGLKWDKVKRAENWLHTYLGAEGSEYTRGIGKTWLIGAVTRAMFPGTKFDTVPLLESPQGDGKSTALRKMAVKDEWFSDAPLGDLNGKDAAIQLEGIWIYELAEITALRKSDVESTKAFVSRHKDSFRSPYDRLKCDHLRRCVFAGTLNPRPGGTYLQDITGNRRFWPTAVSKIDLEGIERDRDQIWAEVVTWVKAGESCVLPQNLWAVAAEKQEERVVQDPWVETLRDYLDCSVDPKTQKLRDRVGTKELLESAIGILPAYQKIGDEQRLNAAMKFVSTWEYKKSLRIVVDEAEKVRKGYQRKKPEMTEAEVVDLKDHQAKRQTA